MTRGGGIFSHNSSQLLRWYDRTMSGPAKMTERRGPREPLLLAATGFTVGLFLGPPSHPALVGLIALLSVAVLALLLVKRSFLSPTLLVVASVAAGILIDLDLPDAGPIIARSEADPGPFPAEVTIAEAPERTLFGLAVVADLETHDGLRGRARLTITSSGACELHHGDRLPLVVTLRPPDTGRLPGFRARALAVRRGAAVTGTAVCPLERQTQWGGPPRWAVLASGDRTQLAGIEDEGLVLGGQSFLYALGGLSQLILSMGFALLTYAVVGRRSGRRRVSVIAGLVFALALTGVLGHTPSAQRVLGLASILMLSWARTGDWVSRPALALVVIVVCGLDPASIGDVRFQLAFAAATAAIGPFGAVARALKSVSFGPARVALRLLALGAGVALGTAPLVTRQFDHISLSSLAVSAVTIPMVSVLLAPLGVLARLSSHLHAPVESVLQAIDALARLSAVGGLTLPTPTILECCLGYLALLGLGAPKDRRGARGLGLLALIALVGSMSYGALSRPRALEVLVLPVAEGTSLIARAPSGAVAVIGIGRDPRDPEAPTRMLSEQLRVLRATRVSYLPLGQPGETQAAERSLARQIALTNAAPPIAVRQAGKAIELSALGQSVMVYGSEIRTNVITQSALDAGLLTLAFTPEKVEVSSYSGSTR